ncbi:MAG TPA: WD40 repeat domain-containing protein [Solirubrobacter sp.]
MTGAPPYVGLAPFSEADADRFFGRDAERKRIIANLQASRFTLLYARSGVGKSSLLRAGVVTRLAAAPPSRLVPFIFSSWSGDPNVELPRALGVGGDGLLGALERRSDSAEGTLLVILDQFEEFFEYHRGTAEGARFADDLAHCVQRTDLRVHVLVSIREDAYSRLGDEFKGRLPNVYSNYLHLDDLDERGARSAIVEPLKLARDGASIEPALVDRVLADVRRGEGVNGDARYEAAHLQYVLRRLWDEEAGRGSVVLRLATLQALGGSGAIFERHFDEAVAGLGAVEQDALAKAFRFLVTSAGTKRAETAADLADLTGEPLPVVERALEHLREARVLTPVAADGQTRYELAHDLLAAPALEWRREREKARELRTLRRIVTGLAVVAALLAGLIVWALLERASAGRQADRARAQALVAESANRLSADPEQSLGLARRAWLSSNTPEAENALRSALGASLVRRRLAIGPTWRGALSQDGAVVVNEGPGGVQVWRGLQSRAPAVRFEGAQPVLSADGSVVAALGANADVVAARTDGAGKPVRIAMARAPAVSDDGRYVAAVTGKDVVVVMDRQTGAELAHQRVLLTSNPVLAFDPSDGGRLLAGDCGGGMLLDWNWRGGRVRLMAGRFRLGTRILRGGDPACLLRVSPDGTRAAWSDATGSAGVWDLTRGRRVGADLANGQAIDDLAWDGRGRQLAIAAGKTATVVDRSGRTVWKTPEQVDFVTSVGFNRPDGELLVTSSRDGVARVWDLPSGATIAELHGHTDEITDAAFSANGRDVVTLSLDGTARSWHVVEGQIFRRDDWVLDAAFSPDGKRIATAAADGDARVQPVDGGGGSIAIRPVFRAQTMNSIAFDPAGRRVAVVGGHDAQSGQIVVADAASGAIEQELLPLGRAVLTAAFSPDGRWLVTTSAAAPPALWRLADFGDTGISQPTATLEIPVGVAVVRAEFSPDGRFIVTAGNDGIARVYGFATRRVARVIKTPGLLYGATFSPDGRRILTYGSDFTGRIWDAGTGRRLAVLRGHSSWISSGAFSPDGRTVVTGSADQTTRVWDARTGRLLSSQQMHGGAVNSVAFSPDGRTILSGGDDRAARIYACATCAPVQDLVRLARDRIVTGG